MRRLSVDCFVGSWRCFRLPALDHDDHGEGGRQRHHRPGDRRERRRRWRCCAISRAAAPTSRAATCRCSDRSRPRRRRSAMGVGSSRVSRSRRAVGDGYRAHFAFDDVTKIRLNRIRDAAGAVAERQAPASRRSRSLHEAGGGVGADHPHAGVSRAGAGRCSPAARWRRPVARTISRPSRCCCRCCAACSSTSR